MSTTRRQRQHAHRILYETYRGAVDRLTSDVLDKESDGLEGAAFDYSWQESEDRHAMRVHHLHVLLQALESAARGRLRVKRWVESFRVEGDDLEGELNKRLAGPIEHGGEVEDITLLPTGEDEVRVVLRYRAAVPE